MPLTLAQVGEENVFRRIGGNPAVKQHLQRLGFVVGGSVTVLTAGDPAETWTLDWPWESCTDLVSGRAFTPVDGRLVLRLGPCEGLLLG